MRRQLNAPTAEIREITTVLSVPQGGTGASTAAQAAVNIGAISTALLGVPGGPAILDSFSRLPASSLPDSLTLGVTLLGESALYIGQVATYTISNYDTNTTYSVSASAGTVTLNDATITYTAPGVAGNYTLVVNGRPVVLVVNTVRPVRPSAAASTSGNLTQTNIDCTGTAFAMQAGLGTHLSSDWEVSLDPDFQTLSSSTYNDTVNRTSYTATGLSLSTRYFARVRYRDSTGQVSDWSVTLSVLTKADYVPSSEEAKQITTGAVTTAPGTTYTVYPSNVAVSSDGSRVAMASWRATAAGTSAAGLVYVYVRNGTTWTLEATLFAANRSASAFLGFSLDMSADGDRIVAGAYAYTSSFSQQGSVHVFKRAGSAWTEEQRILSTQATSSNEYFGVSVSIDAAGTTLAIGASNKTTTVAGQGAVYIWSRNTTTNVWTQGDKLVMADPVIGSYFGCSVALSGVVSRVVIGSLSTTANGTTTAGAVYVFVLIDGKDWVQETKLIAADKETGSGFGSSVAISADASYAVIGAPMATLSAQAGAGAVYVFTRSGATWTQSQKLTASNFSLNANFGCSVNTNADGNLIAVGARFADPGFSNAGSAYLFNRTVLTWSEMATLAGTTEVSDRNFGSTLALSGDGTRAAVMADKQTSPYLTQCYIFS